MKRTAITMLLGACISTTLFAQEKDNGPLIGLYDVQLAAGVLFEGDMGIDLDIGSTLVNIAYGSGASSTMELHYDYSKHNFDGMLQTMHVVRSNAYVRFRPICGNPQEKLVFGGNGSLYILGFLMAGLYVDVGYSKGYYYYKDYLTDIRSERYGANGLYWGWGWNLVYRSETAWGATFGLGNKNYKVSMPQGHRSWMISLGVVYNFR